MDELRDSVKFTINREINNPGKLNYKDGYLFISETKKGIHIIDNRDLNNPINIGFIKLPGNYDIATKNDFLYADSYMDLVIFDISKIDSVQEINRVKDAFKNYYLNQGLYSEENGIIVGYEEEVVEEYIENHNCGFIWE
tara:strand:- start:125 stop:541 length:417 start_codon:yes stop_codon:yes gene_type:complete